MIEAKFTISGRYYQTPFAVINAIRDADLGIVVITNCDSNEGEIWYDVEILAKDTKPEMLFDYLRTYGNYLNHDDLLRAAMTSAPVEALVEIWAKRRDAKIHE